MQYWCDYDNDNLIGFLQDPQCHDYPYADGNGQSFTGFSGSGPHANYFDMTVDLMREFVSKECNFNLELGTNYLEPSYECFAYNAELKVIAWYV